MKQETALRPALILQRIGPVVFSLVIGFAAGALVIWSVGVDPVKGYEALVLGAFGDPIHIGMTLTRMTPVLLIALGTVFAFRTSIWNIGQDGQFYFGAIAAAWLGVEFAWLPSALLVSLVIAGGFLLGAMWAGVPGYFKARLGMDEIVTTLMMNFIAVLLVQYLVRGPMKDPLSMANPLSAQIGENAQLLAIFPGTTLNAGFVLALAAAPVTYLLLWRSTVGYRLRAVGLNRKAARYGGMSVSRSIVIAMLISGGLCGIAGAVEVSGVQHRLFVGLSPNYWVMGIMAALLGGLHPVGVVLASLFISALYTGADEMARSTGISSFLIFVIQGAIILLLLSTQNIGWLKGRIGKGLAR